MNRRLNIDYTIIQSCYWCLYLMSASFMSVYMLGKGYSNVNIGFVFAAANITAVVLQLFLSDITDKSRKLNEVVTSKGILFILVAACTVILAVHTRCLLITVAYTAYIAFHAAMQPFINAMPVMFLRCGAVVSYGPARAAGCITSGLLCLLTGRLIASLGVDVLPLQSIIIIVLLYAALLMAGRNYRRGIEFQRVVQSEDNEADSDESAISTVDFIRRNKLFILFSAGISAIFFVTVVLENFTFQIVREIGGDVGSVGVITFMLSVFEVPALFGFKWIKRRFSYRFLMNLSVIFCAVKVVGMMLARNMAVIYLIQPLQILGLGLVMPCMIIFIQEAMERAESVRGQTVYTVAATMGFVMGSVIGGILIDSFGVRALLMVTTAVSLLAVAVICSLSGEITRKYNLK